MGRGHLFEFDFPSSVTSGVRFFLSATNTNEALSGSRVLYRQLSSCRSCCWRQRRLFNERGAFRFVVFVGWNDLSSAGSLSEFFAILDGIRITCVNLLLFLILYLNWERGGAVC